MEGQPSAINLSKPEQPRQKDFAITPEYNRGRQHGLKHQHAYGQCGAGYDEALL